MAVMVLCSCSLITHGSRSIIVCIISQLLYNIIVYYYCCHSFRHKVHLVFCRPIWKEFYNQAIWSKKMSKFYINFCSKFSFPSTFCFNVYCQLLANRFSDAKKLHPKSNHKPHLNYSKVVIYDLLGVIIK